MSITHPADRDDDTALDPKREGDLPASGNGAEFWRSLTFEELARAQGVQPVRRLEDIMGGWPEGEWDDEEDFDVIRAQMRVDEIEILRKKLADRPPPGLNPDDDYETFEREQWEQEVAAWDREQSGVSREDKEA